MTFLNAALLYGCRMIAVPIVLHLIMRQKPKLLEFPALRFIQRRHDRNQRRLRLRHLLLLLLRGCDRHAGPGAGPAEHQVLAAFGSQESPVAAALVFDAAPHMQYVRDKKTRLNAAQDLGQWLLQQLPSESQVMVCRFGHDPAELPRRPRLEQAADRPTGYRSQPAGADPRRGRGRRRAAKERFADQGGLCLHRSFAASWPAEDASYLQERLHKINGVTVYLIDVSVTDPSNFALGDLNLSHQVVAAGEAVDIQTEISCVGAAGKRSVELEVLSPDGKRDKVGEQIKELKGGTSGTLDFHLATPKPGTWQGGVRIVGQDSLSADDERYFTVEVRPPWPVLLVAQPPDRVYRRGGLSDVGHRAAGRPKKRDGALQVRYDRLRRTGRPDARQDVDSGQLRRRLPARSARARCGHLAAVDRLCRRGARRRRVPRPARTTRGCLQLARRPATAARATQGTGATGGGRHLPGAAKLRECDPQAVRPVCDADALEPLSRLSLLADRSGAGREHSRPLQRRPPRALCNGPSARTRSPAACS